MRITGVLAAVAALSLAAVYFEYRTLFGRTSGIVLLVLFSGLKLLEMRTHRDGAVVAFLCYFLIMTNLLYTQSIPTAALMCAALLAVTCTLVGFAAPRRLEGGSALRGHADQAVQWRGRRGVVARLVATARHS